MGRIRLLRCRFIRSLVSFDCFFTCTCTFACRCGCVDFCLYADWMGARAAAFEIVIPEEQFCEYKEGM